ncbi:mannose-6-phosphate receptor binding protein 1 [Myxocyprinus asiaticus]|uniref:mannose-6-phosphate receptor binding protein 1 n=1 Tax=Myxocyprinus asiaticus TaxID=70543 RepID=UPI002222A9B7|nr:mannose-6-phosphate receptor binding protein 1 [Myxocyprinus asiaticus]XP_051509866.1 mannose-6-phosphate receptor binding protein 1 [Myxocyprinus asiaticus]
MADNENKVGMDTETSQASQEQQSVVSRVGNLPLVSSACGAVYNAYSTTKDSVPLLKGVMEVAESGVRTLGAAATTGSKPILDRLEPQISVVNEYAMKGLDKVEEKLPILQQPADKLVSDTVGMVYQSVSGAKDAVMGAVWGGVEKTRMAVTGGINTVMGSRMGQMVSNGVNKALTHSEDWVDQNLPLSEKELAALAEPRPGEEEGFIVTSNPSYFVRLGKLSANVRERALEQSLIRAHKARDATHVAVTQITSTLDLLETARATLASANQQLGGAPEHLIQRWKEWKEGQPKELEEEVDAAQDQGEQLEGRALSMVRGLSDQLKVACSGVVSSVQGLPGTVQEQLLSARHTAEELQASLASTRTLTPFLLQQTRQQITQVRQSLDGVVEYLLHNTPLNWLVGPFAPQITEKGESENGTQPK